MKKGKKKMNPLLKVFLIVFGSIFSLFAILFIIGLVGAIKDTVDGNVDVSDGRQSLSVSISDDSDSTSSPNVDAEKHVSEKEIEINSEKLAWYDTAEKAMKDTSLIKDNYYFSGYDGNIDNLITEVRNSNGLEYIIYVNTLSEGMSIDYIALYHIDGKYSQPYNVGYNFMDYTHVGAYKYDCDDNIAEELTREYALGPQIIAENGNQVFYGSWGDQKEIESMTINGHKPDKIMSYVIHGKKRYFWYYTQTDLAAKLKTIDYSNYTLQQVTDLIGIKYELDTSVENAKDKY